MKGFAPRNDEERAFVKVIDELAVSVRRWDVWCDFVNTSACAFANAVDKRQEIWQKREDTYMAVVDQRGPDYVKKLAELLAITTMAIEKNPAQDFLGELYMRLDFGSDWHGQFFTPYHVADFMSKITFEEQSEGWSSVGDCCCGAGVMLIAFANSCREKGVNYQQSILFVGQDIDPIVAKMCYIQISLLGCPGYVLIGNSLVDVPVGNVLDPLYPRPEDVWYTPMYYSDVWQMRRMFSGVQALTEAAREEPPAPNEPKTPKLQKQIVKSPRNSKLSKDHISWRQFFGMKERKKNEH